MSRFTNKLQGQTVVILGGTGGVGMSISTALLEFGANVIITSSRQQRLDTQLAALRSHVPEAGQHTLTGFVCDLAATDVETGLTRLVEQVKSHLTTNLANASLNHFIYTAGDKLAMSTLEEITEAKFISVLKVRVTSCILAVKAFAPLLPKSNKSTMTLTSGSICDKPIAGGWPMLAFIASGLNGLTRQLASDVAPIRVNDVAPGVVDTDLWSGMTEVEKTDFFEKMAKALPVGDVGHADDVAEAYLYLIRDANVTGATMHTNSGNFLW